MQRILFLCTGNYYRSRFAEILFNWHAQQRGLGWRADSRGLRLENRNPGPISQHTRAYLQARGIVCPTFERLPLSASDADFAAAARVIAVKEAEHRPLIEERFSKWRERVEYWHVHDLDCATPEEAIPHLECELSALLATLPAAAA